MWVKDWLSDREQRVVLNGSSSGWCRVTSGVPQGSVLGPLLFVIYINDIDNSVISRVLKFADDTKMFRVVSSQVEVDILREDLKNLFQWSQEWLMLFNLDKCKVIHFGRNNPNAVYSLGGVTLEAIDVERDLGILLQKDLKVSNQCTKVVRTANRVLGMIYRTFTSRTQDIVLKLYKSLVRPHLEYAIQAWRPHLQRDMNAIEKIQRRATRMIVSLRDLPYEVRLSRLKLTTLETRRLRGDLIEAFKIMKGLVDVKSSDLFTLSNNSLRGHSLKLFKSVYNLDCGKFVFTNRVVKEWNLLTEEIISCSTVNTFKNKVDHHLRFSRGFI